MKKATKIAIGGLLAFLASAGGLAVSEGREAEQQERRIRAELPLRVVQNEDFWHAENREEARKVYLRMLADYAEEEFGYHRPGSAAWMPNALRDVERNLIWILYEGEGNKEAFLEADSAGRVEFYNLTKNYYGFNP